MSPGQAINPPSEVRGGRLGSGDFAFMIADAVFAAGRLANGATAAELDTDDLAALGFAREMLTGAAAFQRGDEPQHLPLSGAGALDTITAVAESSPDSNGSVANQADLFVAMLERYLAGTQAESDLALLNEFRASFVALARRTLARASDALAVQKEPRRWTSLSSTFVS
jgi:hypothetical protein